jgi:hypothetical protein
MIQFEFVGVRPRVSSCAHQSAVLAEMSRDAVPFGSRPSKIVNRHANGTPDRRPKGTPF